MTETKCEISSDRLNERPRFFKMIVKYCKRGLFHQKEE